MIDESPATSSQGWLLSVELHTLPGEATPGPRRGDRLVGPSESVLHEARRRGLRIAVAAHDPAGYGATYEHLIERWLPIDTSDPSEVIGAAAGLEGGVVAVTCSVDNFVGLAAVVADKLGVPGPPPDSAAIQRDKSIARAALAAAGVPDARWGVVPARDPELASPIGYPAVVKPVDGAASWDVALVRDDAEARELARRHLGRQYGRGVRPRRVLLFEEYLPGEVISAEGIVVDGEVTIFGYSSRAMGPEPHFVELALVFGAEPPTPTVPSFVERVLDALGHTWGPFHLEFVTTPQGPRLIECNSRLVGAGLQHAIHRLTGTPLARPLMDGLLGKTVTPIDVDGAVCELRLVSPHGGVLRGVTGLDDALAVEGVHAAGLYEALGGTVSAQVDTNSARVGYVQAIGPHREAALERARRAADFIRLDVATS